MSLATAGAGAGLGAGGAGLSMAAMAHGGPNAMATQQVPMHQHSGIPGGGAGHGTAAPGTSYAALGADLLDKNQSFLNAKNVRNVATLPIVAVDLYGDKCDVSFFPPIEKDDDDDDDGGNDNDEMAAMMKAMDKVKKGVLAKSIGGFDEQAGTNVTLKKNDGDSYKAMKRYLNKGEGHGAVLEDALVDSSTTDDVIVIPRPHLVMGARKISELNPAAKSKLASILPDDDDSIASSPVIDQEANNTTELVSLTTIAMDGNSSPKGDDYDRVAYQMRLHSKKKVMTILPEEALALVISACKKNVQDSYHKVIELNDDNGEDDEEEEYLDYPPAFAIPGWATLDATVEALIDAAKGGRASTCGPSLHQRSVAACVGALLPPPAGTATRNGANNGPAAPAPPAAASKLSKMLMEIMQGKDADAAKEASKEAALSRTDPVEPDPFVPLVILAGVTNEGIELTAVQITKPQGPDKELHCPFGNISVISSVCYATDDALGMVGSALDELRAQIGVAVPESEEPSVLVTYGTIGTQVKLASKLKSILKKYGKDGQGDDDWDGWDQDIPTVSTKEECVSLGVAVLAASVHGRVRLIVSVKGTDDKMRPKARLGVNVQDVATCAVAVSFNYFGGTNDKQWTEPKVIFDWDRRVPAGPYQIDFTAAECAAHRAHNKKTNENLIEDEDALIENTNGLKGSKAIPQREEAALQLCFRVLQRSCRDGEWIRVGDDMKPLTMEHSQKDEGESGEDNLVAIESAVLELNLSSVGLLSTGLITNG